MSDQQQDLAKARLDAAAALNAQQASFSNILSNIIALMIRDPKFKNLRIADLEWLVMPPIISGQWQIAHGTQPVTAPKEGAPPPPTRMIPIAAALWTRVSPEVDARLTASLEKPIILRPEEWTSGDIHWLIALPGETRFLQTFLAEMQKTLFKDKQIKLRGADKDGNPIVTTLNELLAQGAPGQ